MSERITGFVLLGAGILMMLYALFSVFNVFSGRNAGYELFDLGGISLDLGDLVSSGLSAQERALLEQQGGAPQLTTDLIEADLINKPLNLMANLLLMGFVASIGQKLASIGAMLVRPIKVNLKEAGPAKRAKIASN